MGGHTSCGGQLGFDREGGEWVLRAFRAIPAAWMRWREGLPTDMGLGGRGVRMAIEMSQQLLKRGIVQVRGVFGRLASLSLARRYLAALSNTPIAADGMATTSHPTTSLTNTTSHHVDLATTALTSTNLATVLAKTIGRPPSLATIPTTVRSDLRHFWKHLA